MQATPASWQMLLEAGWQGDKDLKILCGGEALPGELAAQLLDKSASLWNLYGPTETTIWSAVHRVESAERVIPIGRPTANTETYILDPYLNPVPVGVPGELHIGGAGVARGYRNRPELVAERFIPNPFSAHPGARIYKTGDRARYTASGAIEFLGRIDDQVKIRGFRIELGEIEAVLRQHAAIRQAVVIAREDRARGKGLAAYVVLETGAVSNAGDLREYLKTKLPEYMIAREFVFLDALPLAPNGKLDRRALPAPDQTRQERAYVAPRDTLELQLTKIWEKVLGVKPIGMTDNFFELGGHSLLAVRLFAKMEELTGKKLPLATLFQEPTIEQLAGLLREKDWSAPWSSLVPIQPGGSKPPFFCAHAHEGNVLFYRALALRLGPDQPFYALQARGLNGKQSPHTRIEEMAAHYIKEIRTIQPESPYLLGGYCFGGLVAFEMAQQLEALGQRVSLVALFDSYAWGNHKTRPDAASLNFKLSVLLEKIHRHADTLLSLKPREKLSYIEARLRRVIFKSSMAIGLRSTRSRREFLNAMREARLNYHPSVYRGRVALFRASRQPAGYDRDPQMGWGTLAAGGLEIHEIPGYYGSIVFEPNVKILAEQLKACLNGTQSAESSNEEIILPSFSA
jgi:thioesterase domain-containing protein/acyl carrier protein